MHLFNREINSFYTKLYKHNNNNKIVMHKIYNYVKFNLNRNFI